MILTKEQKDLMLQNRKLVENLAEKYIKYAQTCTLEDFLQIGAEGLVQAALTFDEKRDCKFATYAYKKIQYFILDALRNEDRIVRIPDQIRKMANDFREKHRETNISIELYARTHGTTAETIKQALLAMRPILYLEEPAVYSDEECQSLLELLTDDGVDIEGNVLCLEVKSKIAELLKEVEDNFPKNQVSILKEYYGIECEEMTMRELGEKYKLSVTRIGQIIRNIEHRLRWKFTEQKNLLETCEEFDIKSYE